MVEPISIITGILLAGLSKLTWDAVGDVAGDLAKKGVEGAFTGVVGNRTDGLVLKAGQAVRERFLSRRGLAENHDIARALRLAQIKAVEHVLARYERSIPANPPRGFLDAVRAGAAKARVEAQASTWDADVEAAMWASYQQAFREPVKSEEIAPTRRQMEEQATRAAWAEVLAWAGKANPTSDFQPRFEGKLGGVMGWYEIWSGEVVEAIKSEPRFQTAFFAGKLVELTEKAEANASTVDVDGDAVLARLEDLTRGAREDIALLRDWLDAKFDDQHTRHDQTQASQAEMREMLARIEAQLQATGARAAEAPADTPEAATARVEAAEEIAHQGDPADRAALQLIAEGRVTEGLDALRAAARDSEKQVAERWRRIGALTYSISVDDALSAYGEAARLHATDAGTHIFLSRLHRTRGDLAAARASAERALATATDDRDRTCALNELGDVARREGDLHAAHEAYEDGLAIAKTLAERDPRNTQRQRDLRVSVNKLGDVARQKGNLHAARKAYEDGLAIAKTLAERDPRNTQWQRDLSISFNKLGDVARQEGDLPAARKAYEDGLAIVKTLAERDPRNTESQGDLSISFNKLGDVARQEGDLPAARKAYEDGFAIRQTLAERDPRNTQWQRDLRISFERVGDLASQEGDLAAARRAYEDGLAIAKTLAERDPRNTEWQRDLRISFERVGDLASQEGDLAAARQAYEDGLAIAKTLAERDPRNTEWQRDLWVSFNKLGDVARQEGGLPGARQAYEDGLAIAKILAERDPRNTEWQRDLSISFNKLGDVARQEGDLHGARKAYEDDLAIAKTLAEHDPRNTEWQRDLFVSLCRLDLIQDETGDPSAALEAQRRARGIVIALIEISPTRAVLRQDLAYSDRRISEIEARLP